MARKNETIYERDMRIAHSKKAPKGAFVGVFNEEQVRNREDHKATEKKAEETGLKYTNVRFLKEGLAVWVCSLQDCEDFN